MEFFIPTPEQLKQIARATRRCNILSALDELDSVDSNTVGASRTEAKSALLWELALLDGIATPAQTSITTGINPTLFPRIWKVVLRSRYRQGVATAFYYNTIREGVE